MALLSLAVFLPQTTLAEFWGYEGKRDAYTDIVWESRLNGFGQAEYDRAVQGMFAAFEAATGEKLTPAERGRAGLKVDTNSGNGHCTPQPLVRAVVKALRARGWEEEDLFLLDATERRLRQCGYLPPLSQRSRGDLFAGVPVRYLDSGRYYDPLWFYDSPMTDLQLYGKILGTSFMPDEEEQKERRKSYLPTPLITDVDFWINLPVVTDHAALGVNGALANASLWNVSNRDRFFTSDANATVAVAEIAAVPELLSSCAFTIMPLQQYQFVAGPRFNARYTESEKLLWMSVNPALLDAMIVERMNTHREAEGFEKIEKPVAQLSFAESVGIGPVEPEEARVVPLE